MILDSNKGIAALIAVIGITLFLVMAGFLVVNLGGGTIFRGKAELDATKAQFLAETGVQDAMIKIARDNEYGGTYSISDTGWTVDINVSGTTSSKTIIATSTITGEVQQVQRAIQADVTLSDGKISNVSKQNL